jgi:phage shock protein C
MRLEIRMKKKIYRLQSNKMIGGVCAGLAEYLDIDATLIRLLFVAVGLLTALFPMLIFYIIAWIIMPVKEEVVVVRKNEKTESQAKK